MIIHFIEVSFRRHFPGFSERRVRLDFKGHSEEVKKFTSTGGTPAPKNERKPFT